MDAKWYEHFSPILTIFNFYFRKKSISYQNKTLQTIELLLKANYDALGQNYDHSIIEKMLQEDRNVVFIDSWASIKALLFKIQSFLTEIAPDSQP